MTGVTATSRADKIYSALSANERGLLVLRALKAGTEEDRQIRATMPPDQVDEFYRYLELIDSGNNRLVVYLLILEAHVKQAQLISGWLATMQLWGMQTLEVGGYIVRNVPEPITKSDHAKLKGRRLRVPEL